MSLDRRTIATLLTAMLIMAGAVGLLELVRTPTPAVAQIPDSGYQRQQMIRELQAINAKLDKMTRLLAEIRDLQARKANVPTPRKGTEPPKHKRPLPQRGTGNPWRTPRIP